MAIVFEHGIDVPQSPQAVFALLDDFKKVPLWLKRCEGVAKQGQGPNSIGDKLRYAYKEGGHHGVMDGVIEAHELDHHLRYRYYDKMMQVIVDFRMEPNGEGTHLVHTIEITPHSFMAKLMAPMFKGMIPKQTITAMECIRGLLAQQETAGVH